MMRDAAGYASQRCQYCLFSSHYADHNTPATLPPRYDLLLRAAMAHASFHHDFQSPPVASATRYISRHTTPPTLFRHFKTCRMRLLMRIYRRLRLSAPC